MPINALPPSISSVVWKELSLKPIGVQFDRPSKVEFFNADALTLSLGDQVVVESQQGHVLGRVVQLSEQIRNLDPRANLPKVIRKAADNDLQQLQRNQRRELDAFAICQKIIRQMQLPMKVVKAQFSLGGGRVTYYFCAENRVDHRHLADKVAQELGMTVEMNQIGIRDATGMLGGIGLCGREYCCSTFLTSFKPVSIKMAKVQNLSLNPEKVSGGCGRLRCCLQYELDTYHELGRDLPKVGKRVETSKGIGKVRSVEILKRLITVDMGPEMGNVVFRPEEIQRLKVEPANKSSSDKNDKVDLVEGEEDDLEGN